MMSETPETLHISGYGKKLKKHKDLLVVEWMDGEDKRSLSFTPDKLEHVLISGDHNVTTGAMRLFFENRISLSLLDKFGHPVGYLFSQGKSRNFDVWEKQLALDKVHSLSIAKSICMAAAENKISLLRSLSRDRDISFDNSITEIASMVKMMNEVDDSSGLMGYEGNSTRVYFNAVRQILPSKFGFEGRVRHPAYDPVNVMLNYGYGILYSKVRSALLKAELNPYKGVLHSSYRDQEPLVYDLIEEFRQPIIDRTVLTMVNRRQVSDDMFILSDEGCFMDEYFKKDFANAVLSKMESETIYGSSRITFTDLIEIQAKKLRTSIVDRTMYLPFIFRRR